VTAVATQVVEAVLDVVRLRAPTTSEVRLDQQLVRDLSLGSLDLAELAASIEVKLDAVIFDGVAMQGFVTVGELVEHCEQAVKDAGT
jgi:acyl carrier protein